MPDLSLFLSYNKRTDLYSIFSSRKIFEKEETFHSINQQALHIISAESGAEEQNYFSLDSVLLFQLHYFSFQAVEPSKEDIMKKGKKLLVLGLILTYVCLAAACSTKDGSADGGNGSSLAGNNYGSGSVGTDNYSSNDAAEGMDGVNQDSTTGNGGLLGDAGEIVGGAARDIGDAIGDAANNIGNNMSK